MQRLRLLLQRAPEQLVPVAARALGSQPFQARRAGSGLLSQVLLTPAAPTGFLWTCRWSALLRVRVLRFGWMVSLGRL